MEQRKVENGTIKKVIDNLRKFKTHKPLESENRTSWKTNIFNMFIHFVPRMFPIKWKRDDGKCSFAKKWTKKLILKYKSKRYKR